MIPYIGGKSYLASWIISNFPDDYKERVYCEVFGGGGWVLFKKEISYLEIYNDLNKNLVTLFKIIRDNYPEFEHRMQWSLHSREMYALAIKGAPGLTVTGRAGSMGFNPNPGEPEALFLCLIVDIGNLLIINEV